MMTPTSFIHTFTIRETFTQTLNTGKQVLTEATPNNMKLFDGV
jgi:hypothetical protein